MKQFSLSILLTLFISMAGINAFAYDIAVDNADGVTIYYNYYNEGKELEVTFRNNSNNENAYVDNVVIPEEVTYMNRTRKVTSIGDHAFYYCSRLTSVTIPNSVTSIGSFAFRDCSRLTSVTIPNSVTIINNNAFYLCVALKSLILEDGTEELNLQTLSKSPAEFSGCPIEYLYYGRNTQLNNHYDTFSGKPIKTLVIGSYITSTPSLNSENLKSIIVKDDNEILDSREDCNAIINSISNELIKGCSTSTIPNTVTSIGASAFYKCSDMSSVTIPNSVTNIDRSAFSQTGLTNVTIPNSVITIGDGAFEQCI